MLFAHLYLHIERGAACTHAVEAAAIVSAATAAATENMQQLARVGARMMFDLFVCA